MRATVNIRTKGLKQGKSKRKLLIERDVFGVLPTGFGKKPAISAVSFGEKQSFQLQWNPRQ